MIENSLFLNIKMPLTVILKASSHRNYNLFIFQAHHNHQDNTAHGGHMLGVCHNISVEVFDSVMKQ